jgi:hypothetical protein
MESMAEGAMGSSLEARRLIHILFIYLLIEMRPFLQARASRQDFARMEVGLEVNPPLFKIEIFV